MLKIGADMKNISFKSSLVLMLWIIIGFTSQVLSSEINDYHDKIKITNKRQVFSLNKDWLYLEQNILKNEINKSLPWQKIDLPHTWNNLDATDNDPGYRRSASWYRKEINIPKKIDDSVWRLYFEGVNISCEVYVNGKRAGGHIGGYVGFTVDISLFLIPETQNEILIWVDNSINPNIIPSQKSDFFIFGGITRDVSLQVLPAVFVDNLKIETPKVSAQEALTKINAEIVNTKSTDKETEISIDIVDMQGKIVISENFDMVLQPGKNKFISELEPLKNPKLWSTKTPELYTVVVKLNNSVIDEVTDRIGYRWFEFKEYGPFYLNGERLLLRGTHRHEEYAGYGNAMPNELHRQDIRQIKEMGANFVRLAHYPQDPEVYRACDELGLIVWDELPWCRGGMGGEEWKNNTRRLLQEQINQNFNRPSIIFWSLGNELYWEPDFPNGDNPDSLNAMVSELNDIAHKLDPYRLTAMRKYYDGADITDVFSPSIWAGWYSGVYKTYQQALEEARYKYKHFIHTEYGGSSHVGRHTENPINGEGFVKENEWDEKPNMINIKRVSSAGDWSESYIVDLFDWHLMVSEQLDWFAGNAQWAFKDFGTPLRPENPIPYINQKGLVNRAGNPKDAYYVFKSYWTIEPKFTYIESKTWTDRFGKLNQERQVCVFSNCDKVKLMLNDQNQGVKKRNLNEFPACGLNWNVRFKYGKNKLIAIGYSDDKIISTDTLIINYHNEKPGVAERIDLTQKSLSNGNILIQAKVVDNAGNLVPDYNKRVYFDINGSGSLLKYSGTPTGSNIIEFASGKAAIQYIPDGSKKVIIEARTQDFKGDYIIIN